MIPIEDSILASIGFDKAVDFGAFCGGLRREKVCPREGDRTAWANIFNIVNSLVAQKLITITHGEDQNIDSFQLTPAGADRIRGKLDAGRGLFAELKE